MSHLRVSKEGECSPQIPLGKAHLVLSLEPSEALRVLKDYGNPEVKVVTNMRPVRSIKVISGEETYPEPEKFKAWFKESTKEAWLLDTTDAATRLGNPIFGNVMLVGALAEVGDLPLGKEVFEEVVRVRMPESKVAVNLEAYDIGRKMMGT